MGRTVESNGSAEKPISESNLDPSPKKQISDEALYLLAQKISSRGLAVPAIFLLELYRPLRSIIEHIGSVLHPFILLFLGREGAASINAALSSDRAVESLIRNIEESVNKKRS